MPNVGPLELAIVLIIALVVFGPKRLPELGRSLGRGLREFRGSLSGDHEESKPHGEIEPSKPSSEEEPSKPSSEEEPEDETVVHDRR